MSLARAPLTFCPCPSVMGISPPLPRPSSVASVTLATTPAERVMICVKFRFTRGRDSTCVVLTTSPSAFVLVSTTGGVPFTSIVVDVTTYLEGGMSRRSSRLPL